MFRIEAAARRAPHAFLTLLLAFLFALSLGACAASSSDDEATEEDTTEEEPTEDTGITAGTISGLAFTVIAGNVYQEAADGPLTAGADGGTIAFDDLVSDHSQVTDLLLIVVTLSFEDPGEAAIATFGDVADEFGLALVAIVDRAGTAFAYEFREGLTGTADGSGTFSPDPPDATADMFVGVQFDPGDNTGMGTGLIFPLDVADPSDGCATSPVDTGLSSSGTGNGDRFGLGFLGSTIKGISIPSGYNNGC